MKRVIVTIFSALICGVVLKSCGLANSESQEEKAASVIVKSSECDILEFIDEVNSMNWEINGTSITASYPAGTDLCSIAPVITVSEKASISPQSGEKMDFSNEKIITYTVTAEDGTLKNFKAQAREKKTCYCIMDTLKGEWSWFKTSINGHGVPNQFKSVVKILNQNEDETVNYEVFVADTLFHTGSFQIQEGTAVYRRCNIKLPHEGVYANRLLWWFRFLGNEEIYFHNGSLSQIEYFYHYKKIRED